LILCDVNVLLSAILQQAKHHELCRGVLNEAMGRRERLGINSTVLSGVIRIGTHPKIFDPPARAGDLFEALSAIHGAFETKPVEPGPSHLRIFRALVESQDVRGAAVSDAWFAALAIEHKATWLTCDSGFVRYPGLNWRHLKAD